MNFLHIKCGHCERLAELVDARRIYPRRKDFFGKWYWLCAHCDAYVGCHPGTTKPLGRLANAELRKARQQVHRVLDPLWKSGTMKRAEAYALLAKRLSIAKQNCHVGMFDLHTCKAALNVLPPSAAGEGSKERK